MRTTIRLKSEVARLAKAYAKKTERTFTELVEVAILDLLGRDCQPPAKLPPITVVYGTTKKTTKQLNQDIEQMYLEDDLRQIDLGRPRDPAT